MGGGEAPPVDTEMGLSQNKKHMRVEETGSGDAYQHSITTTGLYVERQPQYQIREMTPGQRDSPTLRWLVPAVLPDSDALAR